MTFGEYIQWAVSEPWAWGTHDCCTFIAGWTMLRGHGDPMDFIRGQYDSEISALRRISEGGGLIPLWTRGMIDAGVPETDMAWAGDVGIISSLTDDGGDEACGIFSGNRWITLGVRGIVAQSAEPLKAWRV